MMDGARTVHDVTGRISEVVTAVCPEVLYACALRSCDAPLAIEVVGRGFVERNGTRLVCRVGQRQLVGAAHVRSIDETTMRCFDTVPPVVPNPLDGGFRSQQMNEPLWHC
jgi:hypothetical protein